MTTKMPVLPFKDTVSIVLIISHVEVQYVTQFLYLESSKRICRFYETSKGCVRGADCHFLHLDEGELLHFLYTFYPLQVVVYVY